MPNNSGGHHTFIKKNMRNKIWLTFLSLNIRIRFKTTQFIIVTQANNRTQQKNYISPCESTPGLRPTSGKKGELNTTYTSKTKYRMWKNIRKVQKATNKGYKLGSNHEITFNKDIYYESKGVKNTE